MKKEKLVKVTEAIIFAKAEPVTAKEIAQALKVKKEDVDSAIEMLKDIYLSEERGINLIRVGEGYQFATSKDCYEELASFESINNKYNITEAMFETLAIVAYKQPVTRADVDAIRGVSSSNVMSRLLEYGLIYEDDRLDAPGRPFLFKTTDEFLRVFDLENLKSLPELPQNLLEKLNDEIDDDKISTDSIDADKTDIGMEEDDLVIEDSAQVTDNIKAETTDEKKEENEE